MKPSFHLTCSCGIVEIEIDMKIFTSLQTDPSLLYAYLSANGDPNISIDGIPLIHGMNYECVEVLHDFVCRQKCDIDINACDHNGLTALHKACQSPQHNDVAHFLVGPMKASTTVKDRNHCYPLDYALINIGDTGLHHVLSPGVPRSGLHDLLSEFIKKSYREDIRYNSPTYSPLRDVSLSQARTPI